MLKFSPANAKIEALKLVPSLAGFLAGKKKVYSCDILSGHSCPFASECLSRVVIEDGKKKIQDGPNTLFRCFSASQEIIFTNVYNLRAGNFNLLRGKGEIELRDIINQSLPSDIGICRIHVAGDFFNPMYFSAWLGVAIDNPSVLFYAYTKSLPYWVKKLSLLENIPNMVLTASYGGRRDDLISAYNLRSAKVVLSESEADDLGLVIDHDDSHAADPLLRNNDFALLIHGIQPKNSEASKALQLLKKNNVKHSYSRK